MTTASAKPWYREFWLWFVLAPVIAAVIGGLVTLFIAGAPPPLVVDDFGQIALAVERDQQRDQRAVGLGLVAELRLTAGSTAVARTITISVDLAGAAPESLQLHLVHPTRDDLDQRTELRRSGDVYRGTALRPDTRVYVQLTDSAASWRLVGELQPGQQVLQLRATRSR